MAKSQKGRTKTNTSRGRRGRCSSETAVSFRMQLTAVRSRSDAVARDTDCILIDYSFFHKICSGKETVSWQLRSRTRKTDTVQAKAAVVQAR